MPASFFWVEFVGGPFDGHVQPFPRSPAHWVKAVAFPINSNTLPVLNGTAVGPKSITTSVAFYELCEMDGNWWYHFVGSKSPQAWRATVDVEQPQE